MRSPSGSGAGGKVLVTTLCDSNACPKREIKALYKQRWDAALNVRRLKRALGMDTLRAKTPALDRKSVVGVSIGLAFDPLLEAGLGPPCRWAGPVFKFPAHKATAQSRAGLAARARKGAGSA